MGSEALCRMADRAVWLFIRGNALGSAGISRLPPLALINRGGAIAAEIVALR